MPERMDVLHLEGAHLSVLPDRLPSPSPPPLPQQALVLHEAADGRVAGDRAQLGPLLPQRDEVVVV